MTLLRWAGALALALLPSIACAQSASSIQAPAGYAPMQAPCVRQANGSCSPVGPDTSLPVSTAPARASSTAVGSTVASANVYQTALAQNSARLGCLLQNTSTATLRVFVGAAGGASDAAALQIAAGGSFSCGGAGLVVTDAISVTSATAGASYVLVSQ